MNNLLPRPSGSYQWGKCSASLGLQSQFPEPPDADNFSAEEGTATHWLGEGLLKAHKLIFQGKRTNLPVKVDFVGKPAPNGVIVTEEMWDGANVYVDYILSFLNKKITINNVHIEEKILLNHIYPGMSGTSDAWFFDVYNNVLHKFDLKFGRKFVDEYENPQLMIYASGVLNSSQPLRINKTTTIVLHIVQPRRYHERGYCRSWQTDRVTLDTHIQRLSIAAHKAMSDNTSCVVGDHCHYCSARHKCNALHSTVNNAVDMMTGATPLHIEGDALASELTLLRHISEMVKFRLTALEEQAIYDLQHGRLLAGWGVEPKYGRKKWRDDCDQDEVLSLGKIMGVDLSVIKLDTPTQVRNKLKKMKLDTDIIDDYSINPKTGIKLVQDDGSKAKRAFGK